MKSSVTGDNSISTWGIITVYQTAEKFCLFLHIHFTAEVTNHSTNPKLLNFHVLFLLPDLTLADSDRSGLFLTDKFPRCRWGFGRNSVIALNVWFCLFLSVLEFFCVVTGLPVGAEVLTWLPLLCATSVVKIKNPSKYI